MCRQAVHLVWHTYAERRLDLGRIDDMEWIEINSRTGQRRTLSADELVDISNMRGITQPEAYSRDKGRQFETKHHWYRPVTEDDIRREEEIHQRQQRAFMLAWQ